MSQSKSVGRKRKPLIPNEISVSIKTPKSRKNLFSDESISSNNPVESEIKDGTVHIKKSKRKKLRKTQNFLDVDDETNSEVHERISDSLKRRKKTSVESANTKSPRIFTESEDKQKSTTKLRKKKMKLPTIDDLDFLGDTDDRCKGKNSHKKKKLKKQGSIDSISSSTSEDTKSSRRKKKRSKNHNEVETITHKTRNSRKQQKDKRIDDESEENLNADNGFNDRMEVEISSNGNEEVILTKTHYSLSSEDDETEVRNSTRKRSKKSDRKQDRDEIKTPRTRSSKGQKDRGTNDEIEENLNTANSEENTEDDEVIYNRKHYSSSVDEGDDINEETSKRKKKRSKKLDLKQGRDKIITPRTRNSKGQKDKETNDEIEENLNTANSEENTEDDEVIYNRKHCSSSVDEGNDINKETSKRKKKRSKKSDQKQDRDETITPRTRSSKGQKDKETNDETEENLSTDSNGRTVNSEENTEVNDEVIYKRKHYSSSVDEGNDINEETSKRKKKRSKKSDQKQDRDETITPRTRSSKGQKDKETNDETEENLSTDSNGRTVNSEENTEDNDEVIYNRKHYSSSVDEGNELKAEISRRKSKRSKKPNPKLDDYETFKPKIRSSVGKKDKKTIDETEENQKTDSRSNYQTAKSKENTENNEVIYKRKHYVGSVDEGDEINEKTSERKRKRSKISYPTQDEDEPKYRNSRGRKYKNNDESGGNLNIDNNSDNQTQYFNRKMESDEVNDEVIYTRQYYGSVDEDGMSGRKHKISKKSHQKYDEKAPSKSRISENLGENIKIDEDRKIEKTRKSSKGKNSNLSRKSSKIFSYQSTDLSGKSEESSAGNQTLEEVIFANKPSRLDEEPSARKRKRSKRSDPNDEVRIKAAKTSSSRTSQKTSILDQIFDTGNENKENITTRVEDSSIGISRRTFSGGLRDQIEEITGRNEIDGENAFTDRRFSFISNDKLQKDSNGINLEPSNQDRKSSGGRKRWIIRTYKKEPSPGHEIDTENERPNAILGANKRKRTVRKRWSTELKKKFESMKDESEPLFDTYGIFNQYALFEKGCNEYGSTASSMNMSMESPISTRRGYIDSPMPSAVGFNSTAEKQNETFTSEKSENLSSFKEKSKWWTIMTDKKQLTPNLEINIENEGTNSTLGATSQRRSVRKRWSTELKEKFALMKEQNEHLFDNRGILNQNALTEKECNEVGFTASSMESPVSTRRGDYIDSPMPSAVGFNSTAEKHNESLTPKKSESRNSLRRKSKRLSRSLDLSECFSPLEKTITLENRSAEFHKDDPESTSDRQSQLTPASILKRRGTYDLDVSVTDLSVLKSLSETNLSDLGLLSKQDNLDSVKKNVRFQHVTKRRRCNKKDEPHVAEDKSESNSSQATKETKQAPKLALAKKSISFDPTMFSPSSVASSTPLHSLRKNTLMKETLKREYPSNVASNRRSRSVEMKRDKFVSRIRMPNFTKIHQKALDRVESISEMMKRKNERARLLLSGQKPTASANSANKPEHKNTVLKQGKQLKFAENPQLSNYPANSTSSSIVNKTAKEAVQTKIDSSKSRVKDVKNQQVVGANKNMYLNKKTEMASAKVLLGKPGIPEKLRNVNTNPAQSDGAVKRAEQVKTIATKSKPQTDGREERRTILRGVRGNRRFELLMKMRKNK